MAQTTPNMLLKTWDLIGDSFSHVDLRSNFVALDQHDHTLGRGVKVGLGGIANLAVGTTQLADAAVIDSKVADATITDGKLASANNSVYKLLLIGSGYFGGTFTSGSYVLPASSSFARVSGDNIDGPPSGFYLRATDLAVGSRTTKLRLSAVTLTNGTSPGATFTVGLYPVTIGGSVTHLTVTLGTVVTGSTVAITPGTNAVTSPAPTPDFGLPANGFYVLGVVTSATIAANAFVATFGQVQARNV